LDIVWEIFEAQLLVGSKVAYLASSWETLFPPPPTRFIEAFGISSQSFAHRCTIWSSNSLYDVRVFHFRENISIEYVSSTDMRYSLSTHRRRIYFILFFFAAHTRMVLLWYACGKRIQKKSIFLIFFIRFLFIGRFRLFIYL
jgi:hypothetical protein